MSDSRFVAIRMRSAEDEARDPKYAHLECERRWLVDPARAAALDLFDPIHIRDHYLAGTRMRLREMRMDDRTVWKLTRKYECANPLARPIVTAYLDAAEYRVFASLPGLIIVKTRHRSRYGGRDFSIDRFEGPLTGLMLAEIEINDEVALQALPDPDWAVRDVSHDHRYQGGTLAEQGIPKE